MTLVFFTFYLMQYEHDSHWLLLVLLYYGRQSLSRHPVMSFIGLAASIMSLEMYSVLTYLNVLLSSKISSIKLMASVWFFVLLQFPSPYQILVLAEKTHCLQLVSLFEEFEHLELVVEHRDV